MASIPSITIPATGIRISINNIRKDYIPRIKIINIIIIISISAHHQHHRHSHFYHLHISSLHICGMSPIILAPLRATEVCCLQVCVAGDHAHPRMVSAETRKVVWVTTSHYEGLKQTMHNQVVPFFLSCVLSWTQGDVSVKPFFLTYCHCRGLCNSIARTSVAKAAENTWYDMFNSGVILVFSSI